MTHHKIADALRHALSRNGIKPNTKRATVFETAFLLGYMFNRKKLPPSIAICFMSGRSILAVG